MYNGGEKNGKGCGPCAYRKMIIQNNVLQTALYPPKRGVSSQKELVGSRVIRAISFPPRFVAK
jgi:hypothetical protein